MGRPKSHEEVRRAMKHFDDLLQMEVPSNVDEEAVNIARKVSEIMCWVLGDPRGEPFAELMAQLEAVDAMRERGRRASRN